MYAKRKIMYSAKNLFEEEAKNFDLIIPKLIPFYNAMCDALIDTIPFAKHDTIKILDLGCGTGTLAQKLKHHFCDAHITCLDYAENMIEVAKLKLCDYKDDVTFLVGDFNDFRNAEKYDVILSSFALHHIATDEAKIDLYKNIYSKLNSNGVFYTADIVLGANNHVQSLNFKKWKEFMNRFLSAKEIENDLLPKYQKEDNPSILLNHLKWIEAAGFREIDVIWKYYNFAVYGGKKFY